MYNLQ